VERVGQLLADGTLTDLMCIPTSEATRTQATKLNIPLCTLNESGHLDVSIDGADDVDLSLNLVKGGGGALLREKMVEACSDKFICIVDESKLSSKLGPAFPLPVEVTPFCYLHTLTTLQHLPSLSGCGCKAVLRMGSSSNNKCDGEEVAVTDNGNYIIDLFCVEPIPDVKTLAREMSAIVGVVEHGLFIDMATAVIVASSSGIRVAGAGGETPWW